MMTQTIVNEPDKLTMIVVRFTWRADPRPHRLVVNRDHHLSVEVAEKDRLGGLSWRDRGQGHDAPKVEAVLTRALFKSQMTPLQRIENPRMLHPDGVVWMSGEVTIDIGRLEP